MKISVIVPTLNRARLLDRCLSSLSRQTVPRESFEIVVVDNGSTDDTAELVQRHQASLPINYLFERAPGLHVGRHAGLRAAQAPVLAFIDDDAQPVPTWLAAILRSFGDRTVALVGGNNYPDFESPCPDWLARWWNAPIYKGRALGHLSILDFGAGTFDVDPGFIWGCNFSIRREVLLSCGGFHPDSFPVAQLRFRGDGETHVSEEIRRLGLRSIFDSEASVHHFVSNERMTSGYLARRAYAQGISDSFTAVRRYGRAESLPRQMARRAIAAARSLLRGGIASQPSSDDVSRQLISVQRSCLAAYTAGYAFHQREVAADPDLFAWVLRKDYFSH